MNGHMCHAEVMKMNDNKMWALVKEKPEQGLWLKRVQIPEVGPNDVKIKIHKKQSIRFFLFISYFHHFFKITFIKNSRQCICISKVFKLMLLSHIL